MDPAIASELRAILGERLSLSEAERAAHGRDESYHPAMNPDMVGYPENTAEVAANCFILDPAREDELAQGQAINRRMVARAIEMGGTCSGEHGVGYGKAEFLAAEHGEALNVMVAIKNALDPRGILNPGKMSDAALDLSRPRSAGSSTD